jgi:hypothetical protein
MKKHLYPTWILHAFSTSSSSCSKDSVAEKDSVSSWSTNDTSSSSSDSHRRVLRFVDQPVTIIPNDRTEEEVKATWISLKETYQNRLKTRALQHRLLQDPEYCAAIEYVKVRLGRHTGPYTVVDLDVDEPKETRNGYEAAVITKLTQLDARGLENAGLYASRPTAIHVRAVQEAHRKGKSDKYIAEICRQRSGPALAWAQTSTYLCFECDDFAVFF